MIFYFSGTGNSLYAATVIGDNTCDCIVDISHALKSGNMSYRIKNGERIGFVFPAYYSGLPTIVSEFIENVNIIADDDCYTFAVITCGGSAAGADMMFRDRMSAVSMHVDCVYELKMPDNYVIIYNPPTETDAAEKMKSAKADLFDIIEDIGKNKKGGYKSSAAGKIMSVVMQTAYGLMRNTKKFYADDKCVSCGKCAENCPIDIIELVDGKPVWTKGKCVHCTSCINRCPAKAIQYGKATEKRCRYTNDIINQ